MFKSLIKDSFIYGFVDVFFRLCGFFTFPIFARIFTVEEYGILTLALTIPSFVVMFLACGINSAVQRFYFENKNHDFSSKTIVTMGFTLTSLLSIPVTFLCIWIVYHYQDAFKSHFQLEWELLALGLLYNIPSLHLQYCLDTIRLYFAPWKYCFLSVLQNLFSVIFPLFFILYWGMGIKGFLVSSIFTAFLVLPFGIWWIRKDLQFKFNWGLGGQLLKYGYPLIFYTLAFWVLGGMDRLMLGEMSNNYEVGIYGTAFKFTIVQTFLMTAFGRAWAPHALKMYETDPAFSDYYHKILIFWSYLQIILGAFISFFALEIIIIMAPEPYWKSAKVLTYVSYGMILYGTAQVTCLGIFLKKQTSRLSQAAWMAAAVNFIFNLFLIPSYGAVGAAIATSLAYGVLTGAYFFFSQRLYPISIDRKKMWVCAGAFFSLIALNTIIGQFDWSWQITGIKTIGLAALIYVGFASEIFELDDLIYYLKLAWNKVARKTDRSNILG